MNIFSWKLDTDNSWDKILDLGVEKLFQVHHKSLTLVGKLRQLLESPTFVWKVQLLSEKFALMFWKNPFSTSELSYWKTPLPNGCGPASRSTGSRIFDNPSNSTRWVRSRGDCLTYTRLAESSNTSWFMSGEGDQLTSEWSWSFNTRWAWPSNIQQGMRQHQRWGDRDHLTQLRWARSSYMSYVS